MAAVAAPLAGTPAAVAVPYIAAAAGAFELAKAAGAFEGSVAANVAIDTMTNTEEHRLTFQPTTGMMLKFGSFKVFTLGLGVTLPPNKINVYVLAKEQPQRQHWSILRALIARKFMSKGEISVSDILEVIDGYNENGVEAWLDMGPKKTEVKATSSADTVFDLVVRFHAK